MLLVKNGIYIAAGNCSLIFQSSFIKIYFFSGFLSFLFSEIFSEIFIKSSRNDKVDKYPFNIFSVIKFNKMNTQY